MTDEQLSKWGERYGLTLSDIRGLRRLINIYVKQQEHFCNGDYHPSIGDFGTQNRYAEAWERESDATAVLLKEYAKRCGFDGVDFGLGLYPCFSKGSDTHIMIP